MIPPNCRAFVRRYVPRSWRNSLRAPSATFGRLWKNLRFASGQTRQVRMQEGWTIRCHPLCVAAFDQFKVDRSQQAELQAFRARCTPAMRLLDLGAHWGLLTLASLHFGGPDARCVAVEPSPAAAALLKTNLELNSYADRATILNKAVGQTPGTLEMLTTGAAGHDYFIVPSEQRPDTCAVVQTTIDEIRREFGDEFTHVKIDVEGYEEEVILGGKDFLSARLPTIFLELHGEMIRARGRDPEEPLRLLGSYGYSRYEQDGQPVTAQLLAATGYNARLVCSAGGTAGHPR